MSRGTVYQVQFDPGLGNVWQGMVGTTATVGHCPRVCRVDEGDQTDGSKDATKSGVNALIIPAHVKIDSFHSRFAQIRKVRYNMLWARRAPRNTSVLTSSHLRRQS